MRTAKIGPDLRLLLTHIFIDHFVLSVCFADLFGEKLSTPLSKMGAPGITTRYSTT